MINKLTNAFGKTYLTIKVEPMTNWIQIVWEGYLSEATVKTGSLAVLEALQASGYSCVLNDMRLVLGPISASEWAAIEWAPQAAKAGLKHMAMIISPDAIASASVSNFNDHQAHFLANMFDDIQDGKVWLQENCSKSVQS